MNNIGGIPISTAKEWIVGTMAIGGNGKKGNLLADIFSVYLESMLTNGWRGACHDLSSSFYMTLSEYGYNPKLFTGVIKTQDGRMFDHSWVEVDDRIYDFAICYPNVEGENVSSPIFDSKHVDTKKNTNLSYGISGVELDDFVMKIVDSTIDEYAKLRPQNSVDMYEIAAEYGSIIPNIHKKELSSKNIKEKYSSHKRIFKTNSV
ncbi:lasso peptide biosynthesis protein [Serratia fonticola]|uniref:lasso peptide biosynthesis protein n=1 Tax=Serratia fonticola TaxID=47917 RepID=UPI0024DE141D|nr:lasso peptide biosynthesis protein [Serratia fonticola]MDK2376913.1 lasso peptide biosynthesis protein [Serratia fonticola]